MRKAPALYVRIVRTYFSWAGTLLPLAVWVFIPLGLVHAIPVHLGVTHLDVDSVAEILVLAGAVLALGGHRSDRRGVLRGRRRDRAHPPPRRPSRPRCAKSRG